jgi:hypothetical protein
VRRPIFFNYVRQKNDGEEMDPGQIARTRFSGAIPRAAACFFKMDPRFRGDEKIETIFSF